MAVKSAFSQTSSKTVGTTVLYDLGQVTKGTNKNYRVKIPSAALSGIAEATKLNAVLTGNISDLEGTAGVLTVTVVNETVGDGVVKQATLDEETFFEAPEIECFAGDVLLYTFSYTATESAQKATFTSQSICYIK